MRYWQTHVKNNVAGTRRVVNPFPTGYNLDVRVKRLHDWRLTTAEARGLQTRLAALVLKEGEARPPELVAGVDLSVRRDGMARAAVVVLKLPELILIEAESAEGTLTFPYVPGLLTFREAPLVLAACERLTHTPDLIMVDGQGIAHPRRFGLASHLGLLLDTPTIGCAKSRLCGEHETPAEDAGSRAELTDEGEVIGTVLRTRKSVKPLFISVGHRIDLDTAVRRVLDCCHGFRLPEPTRLAHLAAGGNLTGHAVMV